MIRPLDKAKQLGVRIVFTYLILVLFGLGSCAVKVYAESAPNAIIRNEVELVIGFIEPVEEVHVVLQDSKELAATRVGTNYGHYRLEYDGIRCANIKSIKIRESVGSEWQSKIAVCFELQVNPELMSSG
jgi:hypothetical protein